MYRDLQSQSEDAAEVLLVRRRVSAEQPEKRRLLFPGLGGVSTVAGNLMGRSIDYR